MFSETLKGSTIQVLQHLFNSDSNRLNPNVAGLLRGKMRQSESDGVAHRLGQGEAYFTVREILAEASTAADGVLWREPSDFSRRGFAALELTHRRY